MSQVARADVKRVRVRVSGHVQGVFFRVTTREEAMRWGATGWVRNLPDGRVEAEVQGAPTALDRVIAHCRRGPARAVVTHVDVDDVEVHPDERGFRLR